MNYDSWDKRPPKEELGSLAQSARKSSLSQARNILIILGVLNGLGAMFLYANADREAHQEVEKEIKAAGPAMTFDPVEVKKAEEDLARVVKLIYLGVFGVAVLFVILGLAVHKAPVPCTITGLVLFLGMNALAILADPMNLASGLIFKIIFLVVLVKAVQSAMAYERERKAELAAAQFRREEPASTESVRSEFQGFDDGHEPR
jgi:hypothetical protein